MTVSIEDGAVKVITPTEDTPAWRAGIKAGDYITHINGELLYGLTLDEAVDKMRGNARNRDQADHRSAGPRQAVRRVDGPRADRASPGQMGDQGRRRHRQHQQFAANTGDATKAALIAIDKAPGGRPLGYIVDLRSNPGGLLDQAVDVSDAFLDHGEIVSQRGRTKDDIERYYARPGDIAHGLPVIVLVDAGSASAAEIVAGALQDHRRAMVMGERSFGKGSVQTVVQTGPQSALRLTTARYYTPSGRSVQAGGVDPDVVVPQLSDPDYKDRPRVREADLRRHLLSEAKADDKLLEHDEIQRSAVPDDRRPTREARRQGLPAGICDQDAQAPCCRPCDGLHRRPGQEVALSVRAPMNEAAINRATGGDSAARHGARSDDRVASSGRAARRRARLPISGRTRAVRDVLLAALAARRRNRACRRSRSRRPRNRSDRAS